MATPVEVLDGRFDDGAVVDGRWRVACNLQAAAPAFPTAASAAAAGAT